MSRSRTRCWVVVAALGLLLADGASADLYVDANADLAPHDGSDWRHAFTELHAALAIAGDGDIVRVADGAYCPDIDGLADARMAAFTLRDGVSIVGGYAGVGAPNPNRRDPALFETVLTGDIGDVGDSADNCYHVVLAGDVGTDAVLDGLTISNGQADTAAHNTGGGLRLSGGRPTLRDCTFRDNTAEYGAGLFNSGGAPTLDRVAFIENTATASGAGLYDFDSLAQPDTRLTDCLFSDNVAGSLGGAVRNYDANAVFERCTFAENRARYGGAGVANGGLGAPRFERCVFRYNRTDTLFALVDAHGGALYNTEASQPALASCLLTGNRVVTLYPALSYGGAISENGEAHTTLTNCTLLNNDANIGSGVYVADDGLLTAANSVFWNSGDEVVDVGVSGTTIDYSVVRNSWPGVGNLDDDPLLSDGRPRPGSPCINAGDPTTPFGGADLDGHARMLCARVDIGAYEFGMGDDNCDQVIDFVDATAWPACLTGPAQGPHTAGCEVFDYELDTDVDAADFAAFQASFTGS